ncbi:hypothetical protein JCM3770_004960 [Rhodotorula araucariae]
MLASLAARAFSTVTSPFKPSARQARAVDPASPSPSTREPSVRATSVESALTDLSTRTSPAHDTDKPPAKKARLDSPSPSRAPSAAARGAAAQVEADDDQEEEEEHTFAAKRTRTTRAGRAEGDAPAVDDPAAGADGKPYLVAGLYWSAALPPREKRSSARTGPAPADWRKVTVSCATALPPPAHHGDTLVEDERAFRLPFDILRDFWYAPEAAARAGKGTRKGKARAVDVAPRAARREGKGGDKTTAEDIAKRENSKKPEPYRYISKNVYFARGPDKADLPAICMCKRPTRQGEMGCREDCINRLMQYCCDPKKCPCGPDRCSNLPLNKRLGVPEGKDGLRVIWTGNRGFGLKTMVDIREGEFVLEYRGEIISRDESYRRVLTTYKDKTSYYFMDYDGFEVVDAGQRGNSARFINHSCGPNLQVVRWRLATMEEYQMGLFALHDIPAGTELTYDYGWQDFATLAPPSLAESKCTHAAAAGEEKGEEQGPPAVGGSSIARSTATAVDPARQRCYCGAAACSGFLGGRRRADPARKGKGKGAAGAGARGKGASKRAREDDEADGPRGESVQFAQARVVLPSTTARASAGRVAEVPAEGTGGGLKRTGSGRKAAKEAMGRLMR